ncbi:MAG TPA: GNAT family N-acetyltransferase [Gaiellaceae bacterium]|nr:GNAT family N-acetyltransferase [Gaiellaceae bacterium]
MLTERPFTGPDDLPALHEVARASMKAAKPLSIPHVGDVTWGLYQHEPELATPKVTRIFEREGLPVAFGILWLPQTLQCAIHPQHRDDEVYGALLDWFESSAGDALDGGLDVQLLESEASLRGALERRGYELLQSGTRFEHRVRSLADAVEEPVLPHGYTLRDVRDDDLERRVEVHRAAFHPSKVTAPAYRLLRTLPPYRADLDLVVEAPDGSFAAYALVWLDEENGIGELEPVGTHPAHQRLGLGKAVCLEACRRLRALGADTAVVYSLAGYHAGRLYGNAGFEPVDHHIEFRRSP